MYYIDQYDKNMNFIKTWFSKDLQALDYNIIIINKICRGTYKSNTYKGYIWRYNEENLGEITKTV